MAGVHPSAAREEPDPMPRLDPVARAERLNAALALRKRGRQYDDIARELGYSSATIAAQDVKRALMAMVQEPAKDVLALEISRLDAMLNALWQRATDADLIDDKAVSAALRIMERRAKYLGLDAQITAGDTSEVAAWLVSLGTRLPPQNRSESLDGMELI